MNYFYIDPEVAGGWGDQTKADTSVHPPAVSELHYEFDGWLGSCLVEAFPCFAATDDAGRALAAANLSGFALAEMRTTMSEEFRELLPNTYLPKFLWLKVTGSPGRDDFGISRDFRLVVSQRALAVLNRFGLVGADVSVYPATTNSPT